ncbi:MAG: alcohol dehydrogenase catalytic domain-containing protein, partial [Chloroflexi bacterium]|nr:alcohol dehydrogenase catalytic domain-containing protein [Chloroflexota bacterium]
MNRPPATQVARHVGHGFGRCLVNAPGRHLGGIRTDGDNALSRCATDDVRRHSSMVGAGVWDDGRWWGIIVRGAFNTWRQAMAKTGLSAVWHDDGKRWEIRELPVPETEPDAVSIRVQATSVCGSDLHLWRGDGVRPVDGPREPFVFGHEMMGTVAELGSRITTDSLRRPLKEGDR